MLPISLAILGDVLMYPIFGLSHYGIDCNSGLTWENWIQVMAMGIRSWVKFPLQAYGCGIQSSFNGNQPSYSCML
jgi:hypothetical protein